MTRQIAPLRRLSPIGFQVSRYFSSTTVGHRSVWVLTDGGIESTLVGMALGKQLGQAHVKPVMPHNVMQKLPAIFQKYIVDWHGKRKESNGKLPWFLKTDGNHDALCDASPDFVVCSAPSAIPACLYTSKTKENVFTVYAGFPSIPFIHFDQVVLPRYEALGKLAKLGPLASQKNSMTPMTPLLETQKSLPAEYKHSLKQLLPVNFCEPTSSRSDNYTAIVVGGYSPQCRWYSEDANLLVDNMRRMINNCDENLVVVFTDRTTDPVKDLIKKELSKVTSHEARSSSSVVFWDAMKDTKATLDRAQMYEAIVEQAKRVVVTADLDYATAHAASRRKPVYVIFGDRCRSHLLHFQRWARENRITRKLRLDRSRSAAKKHEATDPFSYLGNHGPWADGRQVLEVQETMDHIVHELNMIREEMMTGKRRKD